MTNPKHWRCPKCGRACTTVQTGADGWKAIYSACCLIKNPPLATPQAERTG